MKTSIRTTLLGSLAVALILGVAPLAGQEHTGHGKHEAKPAEQKKPKAQMQHMAMDTAAMRKAARAVIVGFRDALAAGDSAAMLGYLHEDVVIYEGGHAETKAQYRSGHLAGDIAFAKAVRRTTVKDALTMAHHMALYTSEGTSKGTYREREIDAVGTETMVLVPTDEGWKIRHIHWSSRNAH